MKLIDKKEITLQLKGIVKAIKMTTERVQTIAVQAVAYSIMHKDASVATELFHACNTNKAIRKDSLVKYCETQGHLAFDTKDKQFKFLVNARVNGGKTGNITPECELAFMSLRWDDAKPEPKIVSEWDMETEFRNFIGRMQKKVLDPMVAEGKVKIENADVLAIVSQAFNKLSAEKTLRSMKVDQDVLDKSAEQQAAADARKDKAAADILAAHDAELPKIEPGVQLAA